MPYSKPCCKRTYIVSIAIPLATHLLYTCPHMVAWLPGSIDSHHYLYKVHTNCANLVFAWKYTLHASSQIRGCKMCLSSLTYQRYFSLSISCTLKRIKCNEKYALLFPKEIAFKPGSGLSRSGKVQLILTGSNQVQPGSMPIACILSGYTSVSLHLLSVLSMNFGRTLWSNIVMGWVHTIILWWGAFLGFERLLHDNDYVLYWILFRDSVVWDER